MTEQPEKEGGDHRRHQRLFQARRLSLATAFLPRRAASIRKRSTGAETSRIDHHNRASREFCEGRRRKFHAHRDLLRDHGSGGRSSSFTVGL